MICPRRLRDLFKKEHGQVLPAAAVLLLLLCTLAALILDTSNLYHKQRELQASTDAAALAAANSLPASNWSSVALQYSSVSGQQNARADLPNVSMVAGYPQAKCLQTLIAEGEACIAPANANAVVVAQQVTVSTFFGGFVGHSTQTISAMSTASMRGAINTPYNIAVIIDTTASMNDIDTGSCNSTRIACATLGLQTLLQNLSPCGALESVCGAVTNGNVANAIDKVSIFTFPGLTSASAATGEYCGGGNLNGNISSYTEAPSSYTGSNALPTYQVTPFDSDYRSSTDAASLITSSPLVTAAGANSTCAGLQAIGGSGTYYAGIIYAAQAALASELASEPASSNTKNVMIILSDGDSNASLSHMPHAIANAASQNSVMYPSIYNQCQQAVAAAQAAAQAGTIVYSVAYGSTSSGCSTDNNGMTPCSTMEQMASAPEHFFSDYTSTGGGTCISMAQPTSNLATIFQQIAGDLLTASRLIPNNTT